MKKNVLTTALLFYVIITNCQNSFYLNIYFSYDSTEITDKSFNDLDSLINEEFAWNDVSNLVLESFYNSDAELTETRIEAVREILEFNDIQIDKIVYHQDDRRLYNDDSNITNWNFIRLKFKMDIYENQNAPPFSLFEEFEQTTISANTSTTVFLKKGTVVDIPVNAFVNAKGEIVNDEVVVRTQEILNLEDALLANVSTNFGDEYLESRGMIMIEAQDKNGQKLQLADGKSLSIKMPVPKVAAENDFKIYKGILKNGAYDWILEPSELKETKKYNYKRYKWQKITNEDRKEIETLRNEIIKDWKERGRKSKSINRTLKRYKSNYKKRHKKNKEKRSRNTKSDREFEKITKTMILADAKYKWYQDTTSRGFMIEYYKFSSFNLGLFNIDRIYKPKNKVEDLIVMNEEKREMRLLFTSAFVLINGENLGDKIEFNNIPTNEEVMIISTRKKADNEIELGFCFSEKGKHIYTINNYNTYSTQTYKAKIDELINLRQ